MIGDARAIGSHRKNRHLAQYDKQDLTIDTPYGVVTRRVKVTVDDTGRSRNIDHRSILGTVDDHVSSFWFP